MSITVSCAGRFHSYDMAAQFQRLGYLSQLITSYPKHLVTPFGIDPKKISSLIYWELANRGLSKGIALVNLNSCFYQPFLNSFFDRMAVKYIPSETRVYIGWSSKSERGLVKAKSFGAATILERGSSHIVEQSELLMEEYQRFGPSPQKCFTHPKVIEKELREYEIADYISVPSEFSRRSFIKNGFPDAKIIKNPYGVNLQQFKPGVKIDTVFRLIFVGQMSLRKGVHYLLEAFSKLKLPNAELVLIGAKTDEMEPYFKKYRGSFSYKGIIPQIELISHYQQSSAFVICSIEEGLAMVQVQAMACGLPLLCTTNSGGEDLISNGIEGFVVPIRSVLAISEKIQWMYEHHEETSHMGARARLRVDSGLSWDDYGDRYIRFLIERNLIN